MMDYEARMNNIAAYVGTIIDSIEGMDETEIKALVEADIRLMGDGEDATFTRDNIDDIVAEAIIELPEYIARTKEQA